MSNKISKNLISVAKTHVFKVGSSQSLSITGFLYQSECLWRIQILHHKGKLWSQSGRSNTKSQRRNGFAVSIRKCFAVELNVFNCSTSQLDGASSRCTGAGAMGVCGGPHGTNKIHKAHQWKGLLSVKPVVLAADLNGAAAPPFRNVPYREC